MQSPSCPHYTEHNLLARLVPRRQLSYMYYLGYLFFSQQQQILAHSCCCCCCCCSCNLGCNSWSRWSCMVDSCNSRWSIDRSSLTTPNRDDAGNLNLIFSCGSVGANNVTFDIKTMRNRKCSILAIGLFSMTALSKISSIMLVTMLLTMVISSLGQHCTPGIITSGPVIPNTDLPTQG